MTSIQDDREAASRREEPDRLLLHHRALPLDPRSARPARRSARRAAPRCARSTPRRWRRRCPTRSSRRSRSRARPTRRATASRCGRSSPTSRCSMRRPSACRAARLQRQPRRDRSRSSASGRGVERERGSARRALPSDALGHDQGRSGQVGAEAPARRRDAPRDRAARRRATRPRPSCAAPPTGSSATPSALDGAPAPALRARLRRVGATRATSAAFFDQQPDDRPRQPARAADHDREDRASAPPTARVMFGSAYEGPPGHVHGGFVAAAFDEVLGFVQSLVGPARHDRHADRALPQADAAPHRAALHGASTCAARGASSSPRRACYAGDVLCAEAEGIFVSIARERFAELENRARRARGGSRAVTAARRRRRALRPAARGIRAEARSRSRLLASAALVLPWRWLPPPTSAFMLREHFTGRAALPALGLLSAASRATSCCA